MLLVKTKIGPSKIHGIGLFAAQFIPKGTATWGFKSGFDLEVTGEGLRSLSESSRDQFLNYCYKNYTNGKYVLCFDDARFMNHSDNPNIADSNPTDDYAQDIATRDIFEGEELTYNYKKEDADYKRKLNLQCPTK